ncbi:MAG: hypothetical protein MHM6MM_003206 [Cercozoa sp. M6MM]
MPNLFDNLPADGEKLSEERIRSIVSQDGVTIEQIVSTGHSSPEGFWYDQETHEFVIVLAGEGVLEYPNGEELTMRKGDFCFIPAHTRHRVRSTAADATTLWLAVHFPPRNTSESPAEATSHTGD